MKFIKWSVACIAVLGLLYFLVGKPYFKRQTKKYSPEKTAEYHKDGMDLEVHYSSPFKKGRDIFGALVPYDSVWRTGANEPTTFTTDKDIIIIDKKLPAGTYSLWTKPNKESWIIYFNSNIPSWGIEVKNGEKRTTRQPQFDVLQVEVPARQSNTEIESFTIDFEKAQEVFLAIAWDTTKVLIPMHS